MNGRTLNPNLFAAGVILTAVLWGIVLQINLSTSPTYGMTEVQGVEIQDNNLRLETGCFALGMNISQEQSVLVNSALQEEEKLRPDSHDLFLDASRKLHGDLERTEIHSIENDIYLADLVLNRYFLQHKIDSRPSDGVILALRDDSPIFVDANLLRSQGEFTCDSMI